MQSISQTTARATANGKNSSIIRTSAQSLLKYGCQVAYDLSLTLGFNIPPNSSLTGVIRKAKPHVRAMFMTSMGAHLIKQTKRVNLVYSNGEKL